MTRAKAGALILVAVILLVLITLRVTGFEPVDRGRPGFWLSGEVANTPVTDWSFTDRIPLVMIETRTRYFIPHSVVANSFAHDGGYYMTATYQKGMEFPSDRYWTSNVARDPRVRLKIGDRIYEMTMVLVTDREEARTVLESKWKKYPQQPAGGPPGSTVHVYRVYQRNAPEYGGQG